MSIATELQNYNDGLLASYNAVSNKGGTVPANKNLDNLPTAIDSIPAGGGAKIEEKDVNFYDYDGTLVESWTLAELANKTELPENPTHSGLTSQGWNWSLSDLKTYNLPQDVGQMYVPTDGKTHIIIENTPDFLNPIMGLGVNGTATIDWGDGSTPTVITGTNIDTMQDSPHTYASAGTYEVTIELGAGSSGKIRGSNTYNQLWKAEYNEPGGTRANRNYYYQIKAMYLGTGWGKLWLSYLGGLKYVTLPASQSFVSNYMFSGCDALEYVTIPSGVTTWDNYVFQYDFSLKFVSLPNTALTRNKGDYMFANCYALEKVHIPPIWGTIPSHFCEYCYALKKIIMGTSTVDIGGYSFYNCARLTSVTFPGAVTYMGEQAFGGNTGYLAIVDLSHVTQVPTGNALMFGSVNTYYLTGFEIRVPASLESSFKTASNWSTYADYIVGV